MAVSEYMETSKSMTKSKKPRKQAQRVTLSPMAGKAVTALKHKDKRVNILTEELREFIADKEKKPKAILYPRDPSLDPQLVWKGKDEQDQKPLEVPAVPIYIQEKIHPQAIIDNFRAEAKNGAPQQATREKLPRADALKRRIDEVDTEIDEMVYRLYGLTEEEIRIVRGD